MSGADAPGAHRAPSRAKPTTEPGQLGTAFSSNGAGTAERVSATGTRPRREQRDLLTGAVRGLMVSPWFAAGAGFVIAAGAFMYAPHASLNFDAAPGLANCAQHGCPVPQQAPNLAGGENGQVTASPSPSSGRHAATGQPDSAAPFSYTVEPDGTGMYQMILTETSDQPIGSWELSVVIPGATNVAVYDGLPQGRGTDGAIAKGGADGGDGPGGNIGAEPSPGLSAGTIVEKGYDPADVLRVFVDGVGSARTTPEDGLFRDSQGNFRLS